MAAGEQSVTVPCRASTVTSGSHATTVYCIGRTKSNNEMFVHKFELRAVVERKAAASALTMEAKCYHQQTAALTVTRPSRSSTSCTVKTMETDENGEVVYPHCPSLWVEQNTVAFSSSQSQATLAVHFLPTRLGPHNLCVVIADPNTGREKCYGVHAQALTPEPLKSLSFATALQKSTCFELEVPYTNETRRQALSSISLATAQLTNVPPTKGRPPHLLPQAVDLNVDIKGCNFVHAPAILRLEPAEQTPSTPVRRTSMVAAQSNRLCLDFCPVAAGSYTFDVHLTGPEDVRVYRVHVDVTEAVELDASTATAVNTTSSIPLCMNNPCDKAHEYDIALDGDAAVFACPDRVVLEPHEQHTIMVTFSPRSEGDHTALVRVTDLQTRVESTYKLTGHALPVPRETSRSTSARSRSAVSARRGSHVTAHATVWESKEFKVKVVNDTLQRAVFAVSFYSNDVLADELVYDLEVEIAPRATEKVHCEYFPLRAGEFRGALVVEKKSGSNGGEGSDASDGSDGVGDDVLEIPIRFSAEPAEPVVLPGVACSLTTPADVVIPVSNPTSEELVVEVDSDSVTPGVSFLPMQVCDCVCERAQL